jgi:hypothetical protein
VGEEALFTHGCPVCGYTVPPPSPAKSRTGKQGHGGKWAAAGALPWWIYLLTALFFIGVSAILLFFLKN